ncbi:hypothetical protein J8TS2_37180 [Lederbergia ruris]|uniref:Uncharacterized protein n=1 Tax=Lederbergia ruris TaxID=217495 RepID=A0ABQ4KPE6_9BACI|nr:hypothetical protein [Lederbergia ruris]GIN59399.1 hypothetical protein J8TS2_37180 [Lederbergia ruris]
MDKLKEEYEVPSLCPWMKPVIAEKRTIINGTASCIIMLRVNEHDIIQEFFVEKKQEKEKKAKKRKRIRKIK